MYPKLQEPAQLGGLSLKNRTVMPAMGTGYSSPEGEVTERLLAYLERRARGGVGLIITEVLAVHPAGRGFPGELGIHDDRFIAGLARLAGGVRAAGAAVAAQLHHAGRETFPQVIGEQPVAPSAIGSRALGVQPRELSRAEIGNLVESYAVAARRAREAGFDAVEVHGAHGYLVNQFISPYSNLREDEYGGDALGRIRFAREIVRAIKDEAGRDFPVLFRLSSSELVPGGYDLDYLLPLLPLLAEDGVDAFHVSCGVYDSPGNPTCPGMHHPAGLNLERAAAIRAAVEVPVIVAGKMHDPALAESALLAGQADLVSFGRQHLADPDFLTKAWKGRDRDIRTCLSCNQGCIERLTFQFKSVTCSINPECGEEWRTYGSPSAGPFLVVGGGPAGLQAALTLAGAGATVELVEREAELGGQLRPASRPQDKQPLADWVSWAARSLSALGVDLRTGWAAGEADLGDASLDGVVLATGSLPVVPLVPGEGPEIAEARSVLLGKTDCGGQVVVVGAGPVGLETAAFLLERGCRVTVIEAAPASPVLALTSHGYYLHRRVHREGRLMLSTRLEALTPKGVLVSSAEGTAELKADTVVWAAGAMSDDSLSSAGLRVPVEIVGDAQRVGTLLDATRSGYKAALQLLYPDEPAGGNS